MPLFLLLLLIPFILSFIHFSLYFPVILLLQMPSEIRWCAMTFLLAGCASILWFFSDDVWSLFDRVKKRRRPPKKIFISADCWLEVFDFLAPSQLGLGIALISRRFDLRVDEHFKTRKWMLNKQLQIQWKIGKNGTKKMQIVKFADGKPLPIPQKPLPNKVIGFSGRITIAYIDQNVIEFLRHFHRLFAVCATKLDISTGNDRILDYILLNIWPMFRDSIHEMFLNTITFRRFRQFAPSMLSECPSLRAVDFNDDIVPAFPPDDSAMASDGQAVAKWLFTPHPDGVPKWLNFRINSLDRWSSTMEQLKTAFSNASSPVTFRICLKSSSTLIGSVVPFDLINEVTGEQLVLHQDGTNDFFLTRCPIEWDEREWHNVLHELLTPLNPIHFLIRDGGFDDGLLDAASPGPSDH